MADEHSPTNYPMASREGLDTRTSSREFSLSVISLGDKNQRGALALFTLLRKLLMYMRRMHHLSGSRQHLGYELCRCC